jgi:hypothetical protein
LNRHSEHLQRVDPVAISRSYDLTVLVGATAAFC